MTIISGQTSNSTSMTSSSAHASTNLNGCPPFPDNCKAECVSLTSDGCPVCSCTSIGKGSFLKMFKKSHSRVYVVCLKKADAL